MAERIGKEKIEKEGGYLYYIGKDGFVWRSPMKNNKRGRKSKIGTEKFSLDKDFLYFVDKSGYVARAKRAKRGRK
ncbi:MAG: hypothetical protein M1538_01140 [Candidatus Marsarchaeota archaeon]|jgi:hypothetical protein|nr:hypothetical protein [Candidatus Marsarchaeota archaeon]